MKGVDIMFGLALLILLAIIFGGAYILAQVAAYVIPVIIILAAIKYLLDL